MFAKNLRLKSLSPEARFSSFFFVQMKLKSFRLLKMLQDCYTKCEISQV